MTTVQTERVRCPPCPPAPTISISAIPPEATVATIHGELDLRTAPWLRDRLLDAVARGADSRLLIDLTGVTFLGSAGLTVLLAAHDAARAARKRVCMITAAPPALKLVTVTGLDHVFDIHSDLAGALLCGGDPDG